MTVVLNPDEQALSMRRPHLIEVTNERIFRRKKRIAFACPDCDLKGDISHGVGGAAETLLAMVRRKHAEQHKQP